MIRKVLLLVFTSTVISDGRVEFRELSDYPIAPFLSPSRIRQLGGGYTSEQRHDHSHKEKHQHKHQHDHSHTSEHEASHTHQADHDHTHSHVHRHKHNHIHDETAEHDHLHEEGHTHRHKYQHRRRAYERLAVDFTKNYLRNYMPSQYSPMRGEGPKMVTYRWESHGSNILDNLSSLMTSQNNLANVSLCTQNGVVKVHQLVLSASSPYFRKVFSDLTPWQQPMIFLNNMRLDIVKLLVEFIYKGNISMQESEIEDFLDAGRSLQIEGVAGGNQSVHLEDQQGEEEGQVVEEEEQEEEEEDIPENSVMNSTENYESVEGLREANPDHLRSFLDLSRISGVLERSVRQDVSVNIRRMSKERTELYLSGCGEPVNTSSLQDDVEMLDSPPQTERSSERRKRRSRTVSVVELEVEGDDDEVIECQPATNTSHRTNKTRRSSRYEADDEDFVSSADRSKARQNLNNSRRSDRLRKYQQVRESQLERSSLTSTPETSRNNSFINLGSLYRTRPMESRRSLMAKTTSDFSRIRKAINKSSLTSRPNNTERREMIRTLETRPVSVTEPSLPSSSHEDIPLPILQQSQAHEDPLGGGEPPSPPTQPGPSVDLESSEPGACSVESEVASEVVSEVVSEGLSEVVPEVVSEVVSEVVTANIVNMNGRSMCRVCGMQIPDSRPVDHFKRKHADLL